MPDSYEHGRLGVLLVCSSGGHLVQMLALRPAWESRSHAWVTFDKPDARSLLREEDVYFAHSPTNRNVKNLVRNTVLAWTLLRRFRPLAVMSTGAGVGVPFAWVARLHRIPVVFVESFTRIEGPSVTHRLVAPVASRVYVQWPELAAVRRQARYVGNVFYRS